MGEFTEKGILSASGETLISDSSAHTGGTSYDGYIQSITDSAALGSNYLKIEYSVEGTVSGDSEDSHQLEEDIDNGNGENAGDNGNGGGTGDDVEGPVDTGDSNALGFMFAAIAVSAATTVVTIKRKRKVTV